MIWGFWKRQELQRREVKRHTEPEGTVSTSEENRRHGKYTEAE